MEQANPSLAYPVVHLESTTRAPRSRSRAADQNTRNHNQATTTSKLASQPSSTKENQNNLPVHGHCPRPPEWPKRRTQTPTPPPPLKVAPIYNLTDLGSATMWLRRLSTTPPESATIVSPNPPPAPTGLNKEVKRNQIDRRELKRTEKPKRKR